MQDTTSPVVTPPSDITAEATSSAGATVNYPPATATDDVGVTSGPTCTPASGSTFAIGDTVVTCTAQDAAGNVGSASFSVTVINQGIDTIGLVYPHPTTNQAIFLLRNGISGPADNAFVWGDYNYKQIVGDWDGDGTDSAGLVYPHPTTNQAIFLLRNGISGPADNTFVWGDYNYKQIVGDWDG